MATLDWTMPPPSSATPGPDLPLLTYWHDIIPTDQVSYLELSRGLYRVLVRCYALELFPWEIMSVDQWERKRAECPAPVVLEEELAVGARFRIRGMALRNDIFVRGIIQTRHKIRCPSRTTTAWVPQLLVTQGLHNLTFYRTHPPPPENRFKAAEFNLYRAKVARVFQRWRTIGFDTRIFLASHRGPQWKVRPDMLKSFRTPHPGAVVELPTEKIGWIIREIASGIVVVETELKDRLQEEVVAINKLRVLG